MSYDVELQEWLESLQAVVEHEGTDRAKFLLEQLTTQAQRFGISQGTLQTPYINSIPLEEQFEYPGNIAIENRLSAIIRWNAMAMVLRANKKESGIGGHISTYASSSLLYEIGFHHFFRGKDHESPDFIYFQGHASPGIYARAFLEKRFTAEQLDNFRREKAKNGGLSSYPHPQLMPTFWEFPTVSMGLASITSIYHARFIRYLENRGLKKVNDSKVWCFLGDGEMDEPESTGAITLASREKLNNLIFVINCNLQRLDGPVRGNGKVIQEFEGLFRGAGWNVIKVVWDSSWDELFSRDTENKLIARLGAMVDGEFQKLIASSGDYIRQTLTQDDPYLIDLLSNYSDEDLKKLGRGGHDYEKVYSAYKRASEETSRPTVILTKTIKGFGMGESGEGKNVAHQQKKMADADLALFSQKFALNLTEKHLKNYDYIQPEANSEESLYLLEQRKKLGGFVPERREAYPDIQPPESSAFTEFYPGTQEREVSTTMAFVKMLSNLLKDKELGRLVVPIIPDEARTFGMESFFRQVGIYSPVGQLYEPVDAQNLLYYKEAKNGQILEEGISEGGAVSSFMAAGTAYSNHGVPMIPFYIFYSMFGLQRIGDFAWAASDQRCKGFLVGATAGRTTLSGEGLQHQDGHSHVLALPIPSLKSYDPAFAYEIAVILEEGLRRMYVAKENLFYYLTVGNENYVQPAMPENCKEGILKGLYLFKSTGLKTKSIQAQLFGSGAILNEVIKAQEILEKDHGVACQVWSVTSHKELWIDAIETEKWNLNHVGEPPKVPYISQVLKDQKGVFVAASDYSRVLTDILSKWMPQRVTSLGTDGFGLSEGRKELRDHFEVSAAHIVRATLATIKKS